MHRLLVGRALILSAVAVLVLAPGAGARRQPSPPGLTATAQAMHQTFADVDNISKQVWADTATQGSILPLACFEAKTTYDADRHAGAVADLQRAARLLTDTIDKDLAPATTGADDDYDHFSRKIEAAAKTTTGARHAALVHAALAVARARTFRRQELSYERRLIAQLLGAKNCSPTDLSAASDVVIANAEADEKDAYNTVRGIGNYKASTLRRHTTQSFAVKVTMTATFASSQQLAGDGSCGENGHASGTLTETATFKPIVVLGTGALKSPGVLSAPAAVTGSWNAAGMYFPEEQCDQPQSFGCAGGVAAAPGSSGMGGVLADGAGKGAVAQLAVSLPEVLETGSDSCPNPSDVTAPVPLLPEAAPTAQHADQLQFPVDGLAWRQHFDPFTIDTGIEPTGDPLPAVNCSTDGDTCSTAGSGTKIQVHVTPLDG
jgi:hypothetical protein